MLESPFSRRGALKLVAGAGALSVFGAQHGRAETSHAGSDWLPGGPDQYWRHSIRMQGSTRQEDAAWWYTGRIYAQVGEAEPLHLFNLEGTEIYWYRELEDGSFAMSSRTLTFFRDKDSGEMIRSFENPYTGKTNTVEANRLGGRENALYGPDGWKIRMGPTGSVGAPWQIEWHRSGDLAWMTSSRFITTMPQPWLEAMTVFCPVDALQDMSQHSLPTHFTSTYLAPWPSWMEMDDHPGHVVWHSSGKKLRSVAEIPDEYLSRVDAEYGGVLTAHPDSFD